MVERRHCAPWESLQRHDPPKPRRTSMIDVAIPGFGHLVLTELVCDFNGTLARDGRLIDCARDLLPRLAKLVNVRVVTGDTFGSARNELRDCACEVTVLEAERQAQAKAA